MAMNVVILTFMTPPDSDDLDRQMLAVWLDDVEEMSARL
jgi:hypothetical protein